MYFFENTFIIIINTYLTLHLHSIINTCKLQILIIHLGPQSFLAICTLSTVIPPGDSPILRVVCGGGYFSAVPGPVRVDEFPFLAEQFVRMGAEVISLRL